MRELRESRSSPVRKSVKWLVELYALIGICLLRLTLPGELRSDLLIYVASVIVVLASFWSVWSWYAITGSLFDPFVIFLAFAVLFNGGQAFLQLVGQNGSGILNDAFSPRTVVSTLLLVALGLLSFHLGGLLAARGAVRHSELTRSEETVSPRTLSSLRFVALSLLMLSLLPTVYLLRDAVGAVMSSGYAVLFTQKQPFGLGAIPRVLATFLVPSSFLLLVGSRDRLGLRVLSLSTVTAYATLFLFIGQRSAAILPLIGYAWLWHRVVRPIPRSAVALVVALGIGVVAPVVGAFRNLPGSERLSSAVIIDAYRSLDRAPVAAISEFGGSMGTVAHTLELVPESRPYDMGKSYLLAVTTVVPNLFWDVHPAKARGSPGDWLIWEIDPYVARRGGSRGYSFIAEAYLNFGWYGTPVILGLLGFLFARLVLWADRSGSPLRLATVASYAVFFWFFARAESTYLVRPLVWYAGFPYVATILVRDTLSRRRHEAGAWPNAQRQQ